jgi:hypothetical protein
VANLDELQCVLVSAQRLEESIHSIAGKPEDGIDSPFDKPLNDEI